MTATRHAPSGQRTPEQSASRLHVFRVATSVVGPAAAGLLSGAVGAFMGALAGPPGIWVGAGLGALMGIVAARAMDVQRTRTSRRQATLDDEIGVTSGSMGRPPSPTSRGAPQR